MLTIDEVAENLNYAKNKPSDFGWYGKPDWDDKNIFLYHYQTRDSDILEESNGAYIEKFFKDYAEENTVELQEFGHWLCGWVKAVVIKIRDEDGKYTRAFQDMYGILVMKDDYPVLDEDDFSNREFEAFEDVANVAIKEYLSDVVGTDEDEKIIARMFRNLECDYDCIENGIPVTDLEHAYYIAIHTKYCPTCETEYLDFSACECQMRMF